jgi:hypothetical protein
MTRRYDTRNRARDPLPVPEYPSAEWFECPEWLEPDERFVLLDDGRVAGYILDHAARDDRTPAGSPSGFAAFHASGARVVLDDGTSLAVGPVGLGHPNVAGRRATTPAHADWLRDAHVASATAFYRDPSRPRAVARVGEDPRGVWFAGYVVSPLTFGQARGVRALGPSGHWAEMPGRWWAEQERAGRAASLRESDLDLVGIGLVVVPGNVSAAAPATAAPRRAPRGPGEDRRTEFALRAGLGALQREQERLASASHTHHRRSAAMGDTRTPLERIEARVKQRILDEMDAVVP